MEVQDLLDVIFSRLAEGKSVESLVNQLKADYPRDYEENKQKIELNTGDRWRRFVAFPDEYTVTNADGTEIRGKKDYKKMMTPEFSRRLAKITTAYSWILRRQADPEAFYDFLCDLADTFDEVPDETKSFILKCELEIAEGKTTGQAPPLNIQEKMKSWGERFVKARTAQEFDDLKKEAQECQEMSIANYPHLCDVAKKGVPKTASDKYLELAEVAKAVKSHDEYLDFWPVYARTEAQLTEEEQHRFRHEYMDKWERINPECGDAGFFADFMKKDEEECLAELAKRDSMVQDDLKEKDDGLDRFRWTGDGDLHVIDIPKIDWNGPRIVEIIPYCLSCKHIRYGMKCDAFPDGVPIRILKNEPKHIEIQCDQVGSMVFEKE